MKRIVFVFLFLVLAILSKSQKLELFYDFNLGIPTATSLRNFHSNLKEQVPLENFKTQDNFNYYYGFTVGARINHNVSIYFNNKVTGAKSSIADYSGYVRITNELIGYSYGLKYEFYKVDFSKGQIRFGAKGFVTRSELILRTESKLFTNSDSEKFEFKSIDFGCGIGINYEYSFMFIIFKAYLDFDIVYGGKISLKENNYDDAYLMDENGDKITTCWSGIKLGIGFSIPLFK